MDKTSNNLVVGFTWESSGGAKACVDCRALHGKKFYYDPKPGQLPAEGMPRPPLHPNCRCKLIDIVDVLSAAQAISGPEPPKAPAQSGDGEDVYDFEGVDSWTNVSDENIGKIPEAHPYREGRGHIQDGTVLFGVIWANNGRKYTDGPVYGNYGGGHWEAGRNTLLVDEPLKMDPEDDMDACFAQHDACYDMFDQQRCDIELIRNLESLADDPRMWRNPPPDDHAVKYAIRYREHALTFFKAKVYVKQDPRRRYGDEIYFTA